MAVTKTKSVSIGTPIHIYEGTFDVASVASVDGVEQDITIPGLSTSDIPVSFNATDAWVDLAIGNIRISADNTLTVCFVNPTGSAVNPAGTINYRLVVISGA